jgi:hypothetical protein
MKKVWLMFIVAFVGAKGYAQSQEAQQLLLNVEKLTQFKQILSNMKKGYEILSKGYSAIKNISEGNFSLHKVFLDGLLEVSPAVKNYKRVAAIINYQVQLVKEYKTAFKRFKQSGWFNAKEIDYLGNVYEQLFNRSVKNLDDLLTVITSSKLRMSDDERLAAIDKIHADMQDKLLFLRSFNNSNMVLSLQRAKETQEVEQLELIYGLK